MSVKEKIVRLIEDAQERIWGEKHPDQGYPGWKDSAKRCAVCGKSPAPYFSASVGLNYCSEKHFKRGK